MKRRRDWRPRAIADGVDEIVNEMHTEEMIARDIDYNNDDEGFGFDCPSMDDIVRERWEEPVYVVKYRPERRRKGGDGGTREVVTSSPENGSSDREEEWEYLDEGRDSDSSGSAWVEVEEESYEW